MKAAAARAIERAAGTNIGRVVSDSANGLRDGLAAGDEDPQKVLADLTGANVKTPADAARLMGRIIGASYRQAKQPKPPK